MIKDYIIPGVIVGLIGDIVKITINYTGYLLGFTPVVFWQLAATRFLEKQYLYKPTAYLIGGVADATISAILGVAFVYFIYILGTKHLFLKGIGFGLTVWVSLFGTLLGQSVAGKLPQTPSGILVTTVAHMGFGLALAFVTQRLHLREAPTKIRIKPFRFVASPAYKVEEKAHEKVEKENDEKHLKKPIKIEKIRHW